MNNGMGSLPCCIANWRIISVRPTKINIRIESFSNCSGKVDRAT